MDTEELVGMMFGGLILLGAGATLGGFLHARRERLLTHAERMKAIELGRPLPGETPARVEANREPEHSPSRQCFSTALWVAFWGFVAASGSSGMSVGVSATIAAATGAIGVTAFICGTILAARERPAPTSPATFDPYRKPYSDAEAFDVVSRRG